MTHPDLRNIGGITGGFEDGNIISGIAQPIETVIGNASLALDVLQSSTTDLLSGDMLEGIGNLISISTDDCGCSGNSGVDSLLNSILGVATAGEGIAVGEPNQMVGYYRYHFTIATQQLNR